MPHRRDRAALFTRNTDEWYTPPDLADAWADFFAPVGGMTLDPCAEPSCGIPAKRHIIGLHGGDGLSASWANEVVGINPPYKQILLWVQKFLSEDIREGVLLTPARTGPRWVQRSGLRDLPKLEIEGRLRFQGGPSSAPFDSILWYRGPRADAFEAFFDPDWGTVWQRRRALREQREQTLQTTRRSTPQIIQPFLLMGA